MKSFMAFWAVVRRFKAFLTVGLLTFIPVLNLIATWSYGGNNLDHTEALKQQMVKNIGLGMSAFDKNTRQIWYNWSATVIVALSFTAISVYVNNYTYATWPQSFDKNWIIAWNVFHWMEIAAWCITGFMITSTLVMKVNAIYLVHREWDPCFMDNPSPDYVKKHTALVEANKRVGEKSAKPSRNANDYHDSSNTSDSDGSDD